MHGAVARSASRRKSRLDTRAAWVKAFQKLKTRNSILEQLNKSIKKQQLEGSSIVEDTKMFVIFFYKLSESLFTILAIRISKLIILSKQLFYLT